MVKSKIYTTLCWQSPEGLAAPSGSQASSQGSALEVEPSINAASSTLSWLTIALLVWGWNWGAMGLILAIPITGAMKIIFDHIDSLRPFGVWLEE